ncbi:alpha/beta fold hydrolase [Neobacillus citreus]|uniref:Alpha/beta hydrolase n=1 Tax=Neobacillus citreus TaxID=2833578 RepID=A0A942Y5M8_9BACI|nr:alpha/beta hydrolase [Neobacillus citreus]MCH6266353.1 alpha/beta hydrolase [Neobacillus citreus]
MKKRKKGFAAALATTLSLSVLSSVAFADQPSSTDSSTSLNIKPPEFFVPNGQNKKNFFVDKKQLDKLTHLEGFENTKLYKGIHNGAGYWMEVPENWNGKLVLYAHGYRGTGQALTVSAPSVRQELITEGYAWAASSYSTNGYDVESGVKDTHALNGLFRKLVGNPTRTYIMGHSMGGHVTGVYAEQYGDVDGALPMCGVLGDSELFDFFTDYGLVAQSLAGKSKSEQQFVADDNYFNNTVPQLRKVLGGDEKLVVDPTTGSYVFKTLTDKGLKLEAVTENLSGGDRPLFEIAYEHMFDDFLLQRMPTNPAYGEATGNVINNTDSVYQLDSNPSLSPEEQALNESVIRISNDPNGRHNNGLAAIPKVNGDLKVPTVTLHTLGDLYVPFSMEQIYAKRVAEKNKEDLLVSRAIRGIGHCEFTNQEQINAFDDLVNWVENGEKPAGDNILDPKAVADINFGSKFTSVRRPYDLTPWDVK